MEDLGTVGEDSGTVGCQTKGLGDVLQGSGTDSASIWVREVGADPPHGTGPGKLPSRGCKMYNRETAEETGGWGLGISTAGGSDVGGRLLGDRVFYHKEVEHVCAVRCNAAYYGPLQEDGVESGGLG